METIRVSTKGQVVIPKDMREAHNWAAGQELIVIDTAEGVLLKPKPFSQPTMVSKVAGCLAAHYQGQPIPIEYMDEAITKQARESFK